MSVKKVLVTVPTNVTMKMEDISVLVMMDMKLIVITGHVKVLV